MSKYILYFDDFDLAEGYEIIETPFSCYVRGSQSAFFSKRTGVIGQGGVSYDRCIFYTTTDGNTVDIYNSAAFPTLLSNEYVDGLGTMFFSEEITSIGNVAFSYCSSLTSITIPESVTSIGVAAFTGCTSLSSIIIPNSVTSVGTEAFYGCSSLKSVTIPNSVTSIGLWAFRGCSSLTSITIPSSVTVVGYRAFLDCSSLTSITCEATTPPILESNDNLSNVTAVYVPAESVDLYKTATNWSYYSGVIKPIE